jgi:hypothetical protein
VGGSQLSRAYTEYAEVSVYEQMKYFLPSGPIFPVLGNHDSNPEAIDSPHSLPGVLGQQQSWNYDHVASLWQQNGWISSKAASEARMHYAAYSINHPSEPCHVLALDHRTRPLATPVADYPYSPEQTLADLSVSVS